MFAAGDIVRFNGVARCSVREAAAQGAVAGANAVAASQGLALREYAPAQPPFAFKFNDVELYAAGDPGRPGDEETLLDGATERALRVLVKRDGQQVGLQMIGTRQDFDRYARAIAGGD